MNVSGGCLKGFLAESLGGFWEGSAVEFLLGLWTGLGVVSGGFWGVSQEIIGWLGGVSRRELWGRLWEVSMGDLCVVRNV